MRRIKNILLVFLLAFCEVSFSQIYPVQLSAQLIPPYSGYLPDYADPSSEKLKIILQFNDFTTPQYNIRLKIEIKGNGFTLVTKQLFNPQPINLQSGVPLLLSGADLAPYLNSNNLDFIGINQSQYEQRMALPEGYYSVCVKAYDYYNPGNIQVSNESCSQAWFTLSDPPFLNLPQCGKNVTPQTPQNILFQWTPMHMSSPNSAANTEYEFALWEVRPDSSANPNQVILSTAPIFSTTTNLTLLNYGIAEPPLNIYMKYVWRVRAKDITGRDWFKNNGYSQICTFVYGDLQSVLGNALNLTLSAEGITHRLGKCTWNTQNIYTKYLLQVRKTGTQNWFDYNCTTGFEKINNLEPNTTYEARVRGEGSITGEWSNTATFNTNSEPNYSCNDQTQYADALAAQPLPAHKAIIGLIIQTGQFEVITTQINPSGPPGWYSGKGYAKVFGALPLAVQFNNIFIDDNNRHQQGVIQALTKGIDNWVHEWDVKDAEENANSMPGVVDSIYINGNQICVKIQGKISDSCFAFPPNQNVVVVRDDNGNQWTVTVNPPPPTITGPTNYNQYSNDELDASDSTLVVFEKYPLQKYGFDEKKYTAWINHYELIKLRNGKNYFVPYKSVKEIDSDDAYAKIRIKGFVESKLSFKTDNSFELQKTKVNDSTYKLNVPYQYKSVYAWYDGKKVGKLNVVSLKSIAKKLVIVPVGNANISTSTLQADLNKIFQQSNVTWNVTAKSPFTFNLGNDGLKSADATLMSKYSEEMRALRDAYKQATPDYDKEAYYVFVVSNFDEPSLKGYMVRGRALGFVVSTSSATESSRIIAHELAHGAFGLEHTFPAIGKNTSKNLLDYGDGIELGKVQWEEMQHRLPSFSWLDTEEDASIIEFNVENYFTNTQQWQNILNDLPNEEFDCPCCANSALYKGFAEGFGEGAKDVWGLIKALVDGDTYVALAKSISYLFCCPPDNSQEAVKFRTELGKQVNVATTNLSTWLTSSFNYGETDAACYAKGKQIGYALFSVLGTKGLGSVTKLAAKEATQIVKAGLQKAKLYNKINNASNAIVTSVGDLAAVLAKQKQRLQNLISQYGTLDFEDFRSVGGKTTNDITTSMYNEMFADMGSRPASWTTEKKANKIVEILASGKTIPQKVTYQPGYELFKVMKKGVPPSEFTEYWFTKSELDNLMIKGVNFESKAGLPLGSMAEEYDIYKIIANQPSSTYRSTIAPTTQRGYNTLGGGVQTIVFDRSTWSAPVKYNTVTFIPEF